MLAEATFLARTQESLAASPVSLRALETMALTALRTPLETLTFGAEIAAPRDPERWERVVLPESKGLMVRTNEEFYVLRILNTPVGLSYEGTPTSMLGTSASIMPLLADVAEIPGESDTGWYDIQTGEIQPIGQVEGTALRAVEPAGEMPPPDADLAAQHPGYLPHGRGAGAAGRAHGHGGQRKKGGPGACAGAGLCPGGSPRSRAAYLLRRK